MSVLDNQPGPARDVVVLNAGAAIYVAGGRRSLEARREKSPGRDRKRVRPKAKLLSNCRILQIGKPE